MKILLINPVSLAPHPMFPIGLASLAATLRKNGFAVSVIDAWALGYNLKQLAAEISSIQPETIGITMTSPNYDNGKKCVEVARQTIPGAKIVIGGPHPSALPEESLKDLGNADVAVIGEGEDTLLDLAKCGPEKGCLKDIPGLAYRDNGQVFFTQPRKFIKDLDDLPFAAWDLFPFRKYRTHAPYGIKNPFINMVTARGCPFNCVYCSKDVFKNVYRAQSVGRVVDEMQFLIKNYGVKEIRFYDDDFTIDMKRAAEICDEIIKRDIKILWSCTTRVDLVNKELLLKMKKSGCWLISYGIESGVQSTLDRMKKGFNLQQVKDAVQWTKEAGIKVLAYFMFGLPAETTEQIQQTIEFSIDLAPDFANYSVLTIYPGSLLHKKLGQRSFKDMEVISHNYASNIFFIPAFHGQTTALVGKVSMRQLERLLAEAHRDFYGRPKYILERLLAIRSFNELTHYSAMGLLLFKWMLKSLMIKKA